MNWHRINEEQWRVLKKSQINVTSASIHPHVVVTSRNTKKLIGSMRQISAIYVSMHLPMLVL